jgi:putative solute:sodium symporter small subunit
MDPTAPRDDPASVLRPSSGVAATIAAACLPHAHPSPATGGRTCASWPSCSLAWAAAGLGCGVLLADRLNDSGITLGGFPLGFWFAQQGAIIVFILLILIYALAMNRLDARHHRDRIKAGETPR